MRLGVKISIIENYVYLIPAVAIAFLKNGDTQFLIGWFNLSINGTWGPDIGAKFKSVNRRLIIEFERISV